MATPVIMPRQGQSVESCIISQWFVKKGDKVKEGDLLFSYETDKAAFEEEAKSEGTVLEIFFKEGDDVPVLTNVCVLGEEGEDYAEFVPEDAATPECNRRKADGKAEEYAAVVTTPAGEPENPRREVFYITASQKPCRKTGVDIRHAKSTGPNNRIIERGYQELHQQGAMVTQGAKEL